MSVLLEDAAELFATSGVDAPVREVAEKAGVGLGTVYRHFPQRSDLIVAVFQNQVDACADTMHPSRIARRPQTRTEATKTKILDAAQSLFAELGFENTQLDEVAARAGCSRGGIYAHYTSKEELFLALMEHRVSKTFKEECKRIKEEPDLMRRRAIFKHWLLEQICGPASGTLTLEFKLYAVRRPEIRKKCLDLYNALFAGPDGISIELLFGEHVPRTARIEIEEKLALLGEL